MIIGGAHPDGHLAIGVKIDIAKAEHRRLVIKFLRNAFDERREVKCDHIDLDTELSEIFLHHDSHALPRFIAGVGDDGKLDGVAPLIE